MVVRLRSFLAVVNVMMSSRWNQIESVLQDALDCPPAKPQPFLVERCGTDEELRLRATALLTAHQRSGNFIEEPALLTDAAFLSASLPNPNIGRELGSYRITRQLGSGGMSEVYVAEDLKLGRLV